MGILQFSGLRPDRFEHFDRYCPICDCRIYQGDLLHHCSEEFLAKMRKKEKIANNKAEKENEPIKTFDDMLEDAQFMLNIMDF